MTGVETIYNSDESEDEIAEGYEVQVARNDNGEIISVAFIDQDVGLVEAPPEIALAWANAVIAAFGKARLH